MVAHYIIKWLFGALFSMTILGCHSPRSCPDAAQIQNALEKPVTAQELRCDSLGYLDKNIQSLQKLFIESKPANRKDIEIELRILSTNRERINSRVESFLSHLREGDTLFSYRTYIGQDRRGGKRGYALIRKGRVVEYMPLIIFD